MAHGISFHIVTEYRSSAPNARLVRGCSGQQPIHDHGEPFTLAFPSLHAVRLAANPSSHRRSSADQLHRLPLHVIRGIDVGQDAAQRPMPSQRGQYPDADTLAAQRSDEAPPATMRRRAVHPGLPVYGIQRAAQGVGRETLTLLRGEQRQAGRNVSTTLIHPGLEFKLVS